jgi:hypothetical protein
MPFTNNIKSLHMVSGYNARELPLLKRIAEFKFGGVNAKKQIGGELLDAVKRFNVDYPSVTLILPISKSPLSRPLVDVGTSIAHELGMKVLSEDDISKFKEVRTVPYGDITDAKMRKDYGSFIRINTGSIRTPYVMLLDDTCITGNTINKYENAVCESYPESENIQSMVYARYPSSQIIAESITNHLPVWNIKQAANLIEMAGITSTSSKVLLNLSSRIFFFLLQLLPRETKQQLRDTWGYFSARNLYPTQMQLLDGKSILSDKVQFTYYRKGVRHTSQLGSVMLFPSKEDFMSWSQKHHSRDLQNSDLVVCQTKDGFQVERFFSFPNLWVSQLELYTSLGSLKEDVLGC